MQAGEEGRYILTIRMSRIKIERYLKKLEVVEVDRLLEFKIWEGWSEVEQIEVSEARAGEDNDSLEGEAE